MVKKALMHVQVCVELVWIAVIVFGKYTAHS